MAKKNVKCAIVYYPEFLRDLKASFNKDYEEKFLKKRYGGHRSLEFVR